MPLESTGHPHNRILLVAPYGSYRMQTFVAACRTLSLDWYLATPGEYLPLAYGDRGLQLPSTIGPRACELLQQFIARQGIGAIVATDDSVLALVAGVAEAAGLPGNSRASVESCRNKAKFRSALVGEGIHSPSFVHIDDLATPVEHSLNYPLVVKPVASSASRGVIKADNQRSLHQALGYIESIYSAAGENLEEGLLIEEFIPGFEVALEGYLVDGDLTILCVFDKPEPLDGPYFEETIYVTPSRLEAPLLQALQNTFQRVARILGIRSGPIHAECRINEQGIWPLEIGLRTIGGRCARLFEVGYGYSLEELVVKIATGSKIAPFTQETAAGVLMIPVPGKGQLRRIEGLAAVNRNPLIKETLIDARTGDILLPWPEGNVYPGFVFAQGDSAAEVEEVLRWAKRTIELVTAPCIPVRTQKKTGNRVAG